MGDFKRPFSKKQGPKRSILIKHRVHMRDTEREREEQKREAKRERK